MKRKLVESKNEDPVRTSFWPSPQDYNESIQHCVLAFADSDLRQCAAATDAFGIPRPISGGFASVYKLQLGSEVYAARCFLSNVAHQKRQYELITEFLNEKRSEHFLHARYLEEGIKVQGRWYPLVKMQWQDGRTLDQYIENHLYDAENLKRLADKFLNLCKVLFEFGMAHGDLQHGNILVTPDDELRLVDYDGMFVPKMAGQIGGECGHRNYQHPRRSSIEFGREIDKFSACVIYTCLRMLAEDPSLYQRLNADDSLLFRENDFVNSDSSATFALLEAHDSNEVRRLARLMRWQCTVPLHELRFPWELEQCTTPELPTVIVKAETPHAVSLEPLLPKVQTAFYPDKWWRTFLGCPAELEGINPEILRPGRKITSPIFGGQTWLHVLGAGLLIIVVGGIVATVTKTVLIAWAAFLFGMHLITSKGKELEVLQYGHPGKAQLTSVDVGRFYLECTISYLSLDQDGFRKNQIHTMKIARKKFRGEVPSPGDCITILYDRTGLVVPDYATFKVAAEQESQLKSDKWTRRFWSNENLCDGIEPELRSSHRTQIRRRLIVGRLQVNALRRFSIASVYVWGGLLFSACSELTLVIYVMVLALLLPSYLIMFLYLVMTAIAFIPTSISSHRDTKLCKNGRPARATVTKVKQLFDIARIVSLEYKVLSDNGNITSLKTAVVLPAYLGKHVAEGQQTTVLYHPRNPKRPVIYNLCHYEAL